MTTTLCRYFRTKQMHIAGFECAEQDLAIDPAFQPGPCWCNRTMSPLGQDDRLASSVACANCGRACWEGLDGQPRLPV